MAHVRNISEDKALVIVGEKKVACDREIVNIIQCSTLLFTLYYTRHYSAHQSFSNISEEKKINGFSKQFRG